MSIFLSRMTSRMRGFGGHVIALTFLQILSLTLAQDMDLVKDAAGIASWKILTESSKVHHNLKKKLKSVEGCSKAGFNIMIEFDVKGNCEPILSFQKDPIHSRANALRGDIITREVHHLRGFANRVHAPAMALLTEWNVKFTQLWLELELFVEGAGCEIIAELIKLGGIRLIRFPFRKGLPKQIEPWTGKEKPPFRENIKQAHPATGTTIPWPLQQMDARCKDIGCRGKGAVIAIIDTGVRWTHRELEGRLRPGYNWLDPHNGKAVPYDSHTHGTHVTGIAVGLTIGVAPEAQYIACLALYQGWGEDFIVKLCMQWALCPWAWNATTEEEMAATMDCHMAADIINMSLGSTPDETIPYYNIYYRTILAWNAAGIMHTLSAGNSGPYCNTVEDPGTYDASFTIGNTDITRTVKWHSSRGPVYYPMEGENYEASCNVEKGTCRAHCGGVIGIQGGQAVCTLIKPNVAAPGTNISSALAESDTGYIYLSGTSMSAPAVAGVMALMHCANDNVDRSRKLTQAIAVDILERTASTHGIDLWKGNRNDNKTNYPGYSHELCDIGYGLKPNAFPNNVYGHGIVDACRAVKMVKKKAGHDAVASLIPNSIVYKFY